MENENGLLLLKLARGQDETGLNMLLRRGVDINQLITQSQQQGVDNLTVTSAKPISAAALLAMNGERPAAEFLRIKGKAAVNLIAVGAAMARNHIYAEAYCNALRIAGADNLNEIAIGTIMVGNYLYAEFLCEEGASIALVAAAVDFATVNNQQQLLLLLATNNGKNYRKQLFLELRKLYGKSVSYLRTSLLNQVESIIDTVAKHLFNKLRMLREYKHELVRIVIQQHHEMNLLQNLASIIATMEKFEATPEQALYLLYDQDYLKGITNVDTLLLPTPIKQLILGYLIVINTQEQAELSDKTILHQQVDALEQRYLGQLGCTSPDKNQIIPAFLQNFYNAIVATNSPRLLAHALSYTANYCEIVKEPSTELLWLSSSTSGALQRQAGLVRTIADEKIEGASYTALANGKVKLFFNQQNLADTAATVLRNKKKPGPILTVESNHNDGNTEPAITVTLGAQLTF